MPTYEYECTKCSGAFERFQSIMDKPLSRCPECKGKLKRLIGTGAGIIFKGTGFYQTDYRSSNYTEGAGKDKQSAESAATPAVKSTADSTKSTADSGAKTGKLKAKAS